MLGLKKEYPRVDFGSGLSYGGSQMRARKETLQKCACGPVAALDLIHYFEQDASASPIPLADYNRELESVCRRYFLLVPPFGINGFMLIAGLNRLFTDRGLPYRALWAASGVKLWARVEAQLRQDIPVILSVGPNFPVVWGKNKLNFYTRSADGHFVRTAATRSHYVTVTGIDSEWIRISSWGCMYYISRREYADYVKKHSSYLFSNIVLLRRI